MRFPPEPFPRFIGRDDELSWASDTLGEERRIEFFGTDKIGKSALLRRLAHDDPGENFDVLVYARCRGRGVTDVGQQIADRLCLSAESGVTEKWPSGDLHSVLMAAEGLIELDDVPNSDDDLQLLTGEWFQNCRFILTSARPHGGVLWTPLAGLDGADGARLIERSARANFSDEARALAERVSDFLDGHPGSLEIVGSSLRLSANPFEALTELSGLSNPREVAGRRLLAALDPTDRLVAAVTVMLRGAPAPVALIGQITGVDDAAKRVARLIDEGYLAAHSPEVVATQFLEELTVEPGQLRPRVLAGFGRWAENGDDADLLPPLVLRIAGLIGEDLNAVDWRQVLTWTRALDRGLMLSAAWDAWGLSSSLALVAAEAVDNHDEIGRALHQVGTRALCLGARRDAELLLRDALEWRRRAGDEGGAALTVRNLRFLDEDFVMHRADARPLTPIDAFGVALPEIARRISAVGERVTSLATTGLTVTA